MTKQHRSKILNSPFIRDYGMIFMLLMLVILFSLLTVKQQHPTGASAGRQVAETILAQLGKDVHVLVVTRNTEEDRDFSNAAVKHLKASGVDMLGEVNGSAADARKAIESVLAEGKSIDAIAANNVTAKWTVYDRFPSVGSAKCVTPKPYTWPNFLKASNLMGVANQTAIYAIIAIGMTMVIITAGIDLSVGSLVALASVSSAIFIRDYCGGTEANVYMVVVGILLGIGVCAAAGAFNGFMVTAFQIPPFIVTLGMMMMASGLSFRLAEGRSIPELPSAFFWLGRGMTFGVPNPVWLMSILYLIAHFVMSRMVIGRYIYSIGGNEEAARLSGVPVKRVLLAVYTICGALAGLGGNHADIAAFRRRS